MKLKGARFGEPFRPGAARVTAPVPFPLAAALSAYVCNKLSAQAEY